MPRNVFQFVGNTIIDIDGTIELRINSWDDEYFIINDGRELRRSPDKEVEIILDEIDCSYFERRGSFEGRERGITVHRSTTLREIRRQYDEGKYTYIGKIACAGIGAQGVGQDRRYFFVLADSPQGFSDAHRLPIPFKLRIPTSINTEGVMQFQEFTFWVTGNPEHRFEIAIKIWKSDDHQTLAPSQSTFMIAGIRWLMPRFLRIVQPDIRNDLQSSRSTATETKQRATECVDYITARLTNNGNPIESLLNQDLYRHAEQQPRQEPWVREVVEHMTGLVYAPGQGHYGGGNSEWRQRLKTLGEYPACNVCDQLGDIIQWVRGVPEEYVGAGWGHRNSYSRWSNSISSAKWYPRESDAMAHIDEWAKPGASIFYEGVPPDRPHHESTIIRTRGSGRDMLVQLFDYGPNISGSGRGRGYVGRLEHVAQESGWMPITQAIHNIPDRNFWGVGWRPPGTINNLHAALGDVKLYVYPRGSEQPEEPTLERASLHHGRVREHENSNRSEEDKNSDRNRDPNKIYPITRFINALSGMPYADQIIAKFRVESTPVFAPGEAHTPLLDIVTESNGKVTLHPFP